MSIANGFDFGRRSEVERLFRQHFDTNFGPFYDPLISAVSKEVKVDIIKFDDWLHQKYGQFEDEKQMSTHDVVLANYGQEAVDFLERLF